MAEDQIALTALRQSWDGAAGLSFLHLPNDEKTAHYVSGTASHGINPIFFEISTSHFEYRLSNCGQESCQGICRPWIAALQGASGIKSGDTQECAPAPLHATWRITHYFRLRKTASWEYPESSLNIAGSKRISPKLPTAAERMRRTVRFLTAWVRAATLLGFNELAPWM